MPGDLGLVLRALRVVTGGLRRLGHDPAPLLKQFGLDDELLSRPNSRWPMSKVETMFDAALELAGDPALGIHIVEATDPSMWGIHGYAMLASPDLRAAFDWSSRYHRLIVDDSRIDLVVRGDRAKIRYRMHDGRPTHRLMTELFLTVNLRLGQTVVDSPWIPLSASFTHSDPADTAEYRRVFGEDLTFGATQNTFTFPARLLDRANPRASPGLFAMFERDARDLLRWLPRPGSLSERTRHVVSEQLADGNPHADHVATRLGISVRTLQRQLAAEGTSHGKIVEQVRYEHALRLLDDQRLSIQEIASALGFAKPGSFTRAFKRWAGCSPVDHRKKLA